MTSIADDQRAFLGSICLNRFQQITFLILRLLKASGQQNLWHERLTTSVVHLWCREITVGDYLRMRGAGVHTDEMFEESSPKEVAQSRTLETSNGAGAVKDSEERGALVWRGRATVSRVLAAMSTGRYGRVYVDEVSAGGPRGSNSQARGNSEGTSSQEQNLRLGSSQVNKGFATVQASNPVEDASEDSAVRHLIVSGKDVISLLTRTSSSKPTLNWKSFFENVVNLSGESKGSRGPLLEKLPLQTARPFGPSS